MAAILLAGLPALGFAEYCEDYAWPAAHHPDGSCDRLQQWVMNWGGGRTEVTLLTEHEDGRSIDSTRVTSLRDRLGTQVIPRVGAALRRIPGIQMPRTLHIVILNDVHPTGTGTWAETMFNSVDTDDCPIFLYDSIRADLDSLSRSMAHEMFHCAQYSAWAPRMICGLSGPARWWSEGSAAWFEDLALPELWRSSRLDLQLRLFRERSGRFSLLANTYGNVVFFSWLGPGRVAGYLAALADPGMSQLQGAQRALPEEQYQQFAQDYIDGLVVTPSGIRLEGDEYGPLVEQLHVTTGIPESDPEFDWPLPYPLAPLTLARGEIVFVPAKYAPTGEFAGKSRVFSEHSRNWGALPDSLQLQCAAEKRFRFAAMSFGPGQIRVTPNTLEGAGDERTCSCPAGAVRSSLLAMPKSNQDRAVADASAESNCSCPVGSWTIAPEDVENWQVDEVSKRSGRIRLADPGVIDLTFLPDGTAAFSAERIIVEQPTRTITGGGSNRFTHEVLLQRSYKQTWRWHAVENLITLVETSPMRMEDITTVISDIPTISGPFRGVKRRSSEAERAPDDGFRRPFQCIGNELILGRASLMDLIPGARAVAPFDPEIEAQYEAGRLKVHKHYPLSGRYIRH